MNTARPILFSPCRSWGPELRGSTWRLPSFSSLSIPARLEGMRAEAFDVAATVRRSLQDRLWIRLVSPASRGEAYQVAEKPSVHHSRALGRTGVLLKILSFSVSVRACLCVFSSFPSLGRPEEANRRARHGTQDISGRTTVTHAGMATSRRRFIGVREDSVRDW